MDAIISVDTAIAHLAGAMAKPVYTAIPYICDARWSAFGKTSYWYPTMRLYRQPSPNDWNSVFSNISWDIAKKINRQ